MAAELSTDITRMISLTSKTKLVLLFGLINAVFRV